MLTPSIQALTATSLDIFKDQKIDELATVNTENLRNNLAKLSPYQLEEFWEILKKPNWFISQFDLVTKVIKVIPGNIPEPIWNIFTKAIDKQFPHKAIDQSIFEENLPLMETLMRFYIQDMSDLGSLKLLMNQDKSIKSILKIFINKLNPNDYITLFENVFQQGKIKYINELIEVVPEATLKKCFSESKDNDLSEIFGKMDTETLDFFLSKFKNIMGASFEGFLALIIKHSPPTMQSLQKILNYVDPSNQQSFLMHNAGGIILNFIHYLVLKELIEKNDKIEVTTKTYSIPLEKNSIPFIFAKKHDSKSLLLNFSVNKEELLNLFEFFTQYHINISQSISNTCNSSGFTSLELACFIGNKDVTGLILNSLSKDDFEKILYQKDKVFDIFSLAKLYNSRSGCHELLLKNLQDKLEISFEDYLKLKNSS